MRPWMFVLVLAGCADVPEECECLTETYGAIGVYVVNDEDSTGLFASLDVVNAAGAPVSTSCGLETTAGTCVKWTVSGARELGVYTVTASADGHADTTAAVTVEDGGGGCPAYQIFTMVLIPD